MEFSGLCVMVAGAGAVMPQWVSIDGLDDPASTPASNT